MRKRDLEQYRQQLVAMRDRLLGVVSAVTEQARQPSGGQGESELSNAPMHLADMGTDEFMHGLNATLLSQTRTSARPRRGRSVAWPSLLEAARPTAKPRCRSA